VSVRPEIAAPITDLPSAMAWVDGLTRAGLMFHFEDSPDQIEHAGSAEPFFTPEEWPVLEDRVATMYALDWPEHGCPIGYALEVMGEDA
jgi:hypothetical protein